MPRTLMRRQGRPLMRAVSAPLSVAAGTGGGCRTKEGGRTQRGWEGDGQGTSPTNNQKTAADELADFFIGLRASGLFFFEVGAEFKSAVRGSAENYDLSIFSFPLKIGLKILMNFVK
ncbi:hypothetical protein CEXT_199231 [Caerostris extrusa]|uniref:Uncharacterized protein n=1 Tax=Caerostris extrusa TaxID=172846 RepID=A0AAV4WV01_CAEEX|nr:hypothetical protein CEXT_199231 [Caerostris extrusa]